MKSIYKPRYHQMETKYIQLNKFAGSIYVYLIKKTKRMPDFYLNIWNKFEKNFNNILRFFYVNGLWYGKHAIKCVF